MSLYATVKGSWTVDCMFRLSSICQQFILPTLTSHVRMSKAEELADISKSKGVGALFVSRNSHDIDQFGQYKTVNSIRQYKNNVRSGSKSFVPWQPQRGQPKA